MGSKRLLKVVKGCQSLSKLVKAKLVMDSTKMPKLVGKEVNTGLTQLVESCQRMSEVVKAA